MDLDEKFKKGCGEKREVWVVDACGSAFAWRHSPQSGGVKIFCVDEERVRKSEDLLDLGNELLDEEAEESYYPETIIPV